MRCVVYTRVSTEEQTRKDYNSLESQDEHCQKYIDLKKHEGWEYTDTYSDPGYTGGNLNRPGLAALRRDAQLRKFDMVVCYKIDRLTRSLKDFYVVWEELEKTNVGFSASSQEINTATSQGKLMLNMLLSFAQYEREINSERVRDKMAQKAAKGHWTGGWVPYGYDYDTSKKLLVPNVEEAAAINLIFEMFAERNGQKKIANYLNSAGYRTKARTKVAEDGTVTSTGNMRFNANRITEILKNPLYLGIIRFKGTDFDGQHDPILVNRKLWFAAAELLETKRSPSAVRVNIDSYSFTLKGLVYCDICKSCMSSDFSGKKDKNGLPYLYYTCTAVKKMGAECDCTLRTIPARPLEEIIGKALTFLGTNQDVLGRVVDKASKVYLSKVKPLEEKAAELERLQQDIKVKTKNIVQLLAKQGHQALSDELEVEMEELHKDKKLIADQLVRIRSEIKQFKSGQLSLDVIRETLQRFDALIDHMTVEQRKAMMQLLIRHISIAPLDPIKDKTALEGKLPKGQIITQIRTKWYVIKLEIWEIPANSVDFKDSGKSSYQGGDGSSGRTRTYDQVINSHLLYQLSY